MPFALIKTETGFTIKPVRPSLPGFLFMSAFLVAFGGFLMWIAIKEGDREMIIAASIIVPLSVLGGIGGHVWEYLWQKTRGPILHYHSGQRTFTFPRINLAMSADQIEAFAVVTGRKEKSGTGRDTTTQWQLYAADGKTHHLITCRKTQEIQPFNNAIQRETNVPVVYRANAVDDDELEPVA